MSTRSAVLVFAMVAVSACGGQDLRIGSNEGGVANDSGLPLATGRGEDGPAESSDGAWSGVAEMTDSSAVAVATCVGEPPDASATLGVGFAALTPPECGESLGTAHPVASSGELSALLPGTWSVCGGPLFGMPISAANGVELTSDGQYHVLGASPNDSLVPLDSVPSSDAGSDSEAGSGLAFDGTYDVVDGSASYGPGTYELQLHPANGGLFQGQIVVMDSPRQLQYFAPNAGPQTLSPSAPWSPRASVCSCVDTQAMKVSETDPAGLVAAMIGRWLWCGTEPVSSYPILETTNPAIWLDGPVLGVEFANDGTWYVLHEDPSGALVRGTSPSDHGSFQIVSALPVSLAGGFLGPEPLSIQVQTSQPESPDADVVDYAQAIVTENPRVLLLTTINAPAVRGLSYSVFFPVP